MRVLIAEDDSVSRLILQKAVESFGHECLVARDGEEAWAVLQNAEVDVVISDWMMPGMDGVELCRRVREEMRDDASPGTGPEGHPPGPGTERPAYVYFVFVTALSDKEHFLAAMQAGADDYLTKPLDRLDLRARLNAAERVTSLYSDLAAQKAALEQLNSRLFEQSRTDPMTQLNNRLRLNEDLATLQARVERYGHMYSVALFDVDRFKRYNDRYGHLAGDDVLRRVAQTAAGRLRQGDGLYRYGGEEFLIILPEQPLSAAAMAADKLRVAVEALGIPHEDNPPLNVVTISLGVTSLRPGEHKSIEALLHEADQALYEAKSGGRNQVAVSQGTGSAAPPRSAPLAD